MKRLLMPILESAMTSRVYLRSSDRIRVTAVLWERTNDS